LRLARQALLNAREWPLLEHSGSKPNVGSSKANRTFLKGRGISGLTLSGHLREALFRLQSSFRVRVLSKPALALLCTLVRHGQETA
jgi:hypothetical protein